jgi:hypothetical protein
MAAVLCVADPNKATAKLGELHAVTVHGAPRAFPPCGLSDLSHAGQRWIVPGSPRGIIATHQFHVFPLHGDASGLERAVRISQRPPPGPTPRQNDERPCEDLGTGFGTATNFTLGFTKIKPCR